MSLLALSSDREQRDELLATDSNCYLFLAAACSIDVVDYSAILCDLNESKCANKNVTESERAARIGANDEASELLRFISKKFD